MPAYQHHSGCSLQEHVAHKFCQEGGRRSCHANNAAVAGSFPVPAEVDEFLQQTEKYIKDLTHRLVNFRAKEEAQEAAQEAMAEVRQAGSRQASGTGSI